MPATTWNWIGSATPVPQVDVRVPAAIAAGNLFGVQRNGKKVEVVAPSGVAADVTALLATAVNTSTIPEFRNEIQAADLAGTISFTSKTPGKPFPATYYAAVGTGGGAPTFNASGAQTASSGPNHFDSLGNWISAAGAFGIPITGDTVIFEGNNVPLLYSLNQPGITLAKMDIRETYNGLIGLPRFNGIYWEDRDTYLKIGTTILRNSSRAQRVKIDNAAILADVVADTQASPIDPEANAAFLWKGTNAGNTFSVQRGYVGVGYFAGELATVNNLSVAFKTSRDSDANVWCGPNVTLSGTITKSGGTLRLKTGFDTLKQLDGQTYIEGDGLNIATLLQTSGGIVYYSSNGTIAKLVGDDDAIVNFNGDIRPKNVTVCEWNGDLRNLIDEWTSVIWGGGGIKSRGPHGLKLGEDILIQVTKL
jgi:hypothetical protein